MLKDSLAIALTMLLLASGCGPAAQPDAPAGPGAPIQVQIVHPTRGTIIRSVTLPAEIRAYQQTTLYAKVTGYLRTISVDKGDAIKAGDLLAEIEAPELMADAAKAKAELAVAEVDYKRVSEAEKKAPDLVIPLSVDTAKSRFEAAKANLERAETFLSFTKIVAPFSGVITRRMVDAGAFIAAATAGNPQSAALLGLADFSTVRVQVAVPEKEAELVAKDEPVEVTAEGLPGRKFEGTITRFSYALDDATKTMLAEIELLNPKLELRPGMYASVKIGIERKENALLVPGDAVVTEKAGSSVFILAENKAKKVPVKVGFTDGTNSEVLSGLEEGQAVILPGKRGLSDGEPVAAAEAK